MPVTTASAAAHITPVVLKTFYNHTKRKFKGGDPTEKAWDDLMYDEAFHIVKAFIELGTRNTVESLQAYTNTHVPAPFWCAVVPAKIPLPSCNQAADALIEWFGPEELKTVVGGERWWQVRGLEWIDAEWITEKDYLENRDFPQEHNFTDDEKTTMRMEHLERVMLYVHGGAYFWGSVNTHRYQIIRYARKMRGRAFAVNYRKAPQYPWPCPLQDVLAAYFYLTAPPPGSVHRAVPPSQLVFAGDSAGAALCLTALTVLRDLGLPQPAGAVLISPWVDMTHSFPSVMKNSATDIIPPHGFIHKPSTLWPVHPKPEGGYPRVIPTKTKPPPQPGHADKLKPTTEEVVNQIRERLRQTMERGEEVHSSDLQDDPTEILSQKEMQSQGGVDVSHGATSPTDGSPTAGADDENTESAKENLDIVLDFWEPKPPKVLMEDPNAIPWELRAQIQLYATTEQLSHPLVSPVLQSSLGNLCPLYILAGDGECLRDEIIYFAHKAAHPKDYPTRKGVLRDGRRQKENAEKFQTPTKVHLQVFDDMCHVLTVFTFTDAAKYAYRSITEFVKHVTDNSDEHLDRNPFPVSHEANTQLSDSQSRAGTYSSSSPEKASENFYPESKSASHQNAGSDIPAVFMIRERVDVFGKIRPMEPAEDIEALCIRPQEIGIIKEQPVRRWLSGQEAWDKKYKRTAEHVLRKRKQYEEKAQRLLDHAREQGLIHDELQPTHSSASVADDVSSVGEVEPQRRWGPLDLKDERPPPSAIAARRDTHEAVALLKKTLYHNAPVTHHQVPKLKTSDALRAAFDPDDHPTKAPQQSVSEQQVHTQFIPVHGLRIWQPLVELFMRKSTQKVEDGIRSTKDRINGSPNGEGL